MAYLKIENCEEKKARLQVCGQRRRHQCWMSGLPRARGLLGCVAFGRSAVLAGVDGWGLQNANSGPPHVHPVLQGGRAAVGDRRES